MERQIDQAISFYRSNKLVFESLVSNVRQIGSVMPFVGEELVKAYFGSRNDLVSELQSKTRTEEATISLGKGNSSFLVILDELIKIHRQTVVDQHIMRYYADDKIDDYYIETQPLRLIPYINGHHAITSNLDHAIEHAYNLAKKQPSVIYPNENKRRVELLRSGSSYSNENIILKIHGDIMSDSSNRILTIQEYDKSYSEDSDFFQALKQWLQKYVVLFIGVDILKDRYLSDLLKKTSDGVSIHFAFVACSDDEEQKRLLYDTLESMGILPIIYDEARPDSLELLLHKFLLDIKNAPQVEYGELGYQYSHQDLIGRKEQVQSLQRFLAQSDQFLWTIIGGTKHTGRTKLAYDFSRRYASNWEWYIIDADEIDAFLMGQEKIQQARKKRRNLLVFFDDFQWYNYANLTSIFFSNGCFNRYSQKVRFVFILCDAEVPKFKKAILSAPQNLLNKATGAFYSNDLISTESLAPEELLDVCYDYLYYTHDSLEPTSSLQSLFDGFKDELLNYIRDLVDNNAADLLRLSILKTIQLFKKSSGEEYLLDSELVSVLFKQIVSTMANRHNSSVNYDINKWYDDFTAHAESAKELKEYYNHKEESITATNQEEGLRFSSLGRIANSELNDKEIVGEDDDRRDDRQSNKE